LAAGVVSTRNAPAVTPVAAAAYRSRPTVPSSLKIDSCYLACGSPATVQSTRPWLTAAFAGPDGGTVSATFEVHDAAHTTLVADPAWCFTVMSTDSASSGSVAACTTEFVDDEWQHLVGVFDKTAGTIRLYVNGPTASGGRTVEVAAPATWSAEGEFAVGGAWQSAADAWVGGVDEVYASQSVWSEELIYLRAQR
jgi:hypothetical protein